MKAILTSAGFDNDNLVPVFHKMLGKPSSDARALFIPTALNTKEARGYINVFLEDLYKIGITDERIDSYDLDRMFEKEKAKDYDVVFVCPGDPEYLLEKVNEMKFPEVLKAFLDNGGIYIGVSAGSDIAAGNFSGNLGFLRAEIKCHAMEGSGNGILDVSCTDMIRLTDDQAVIIDGPQAMIVS